MEIILRPFFLIFLLCFNNLSYASYFEKMQIPPLEDLHGKVSLLFHQDDSLELIAADYYPNNGAAWRSSLSESNQSTLSRYERFQCLFKWSKYSRDESTIQFKLIGYFNHNQGNVSNALIEISDDLSEHWKNIPDHKEDSRSFVDFQKVVIHQYMSKYCNVAFLKSVYSPLERFKQFFSSNSKDSHSSVTSSDYPRDSFPEPKATLKSRDNNQTHQAISR